MKRDFAGITNILDLGQEMPKTIIYCRTKNDCSKVYLHLRKYARVKCLVTMYHSSLTPATKRDVQDKFKNGDELRCLSATIAFGMVYKFLKN